MMISKGYVPFADGQIHFRHRSGQQGTPTVFLHQTASSSAMYEAVMQALPSGGPLYALDTPGFGGSTRPPQKPDMDYYVQSMMQAIDALGIDQFNLFGHHTGAAIACQMAAEYPQRVLKLGMIGPVQLTDEERSLWQSTAIKPLNMDLSATHFDEAWQRVTHLDTLPIVHAPSVALATREAIDTLIAGDRWHEAYEAVFAQDFPAFFSRVQCPMLLICGDQDVLYPYFNRASVARPDARAVTLEAGAYVLDQQPTVMAELIQGFFMQENGLRPH